MAYGQATREAMESETVGSGSEYWRPQDGENEVRVLPPWAEDVPRFWRRTGTHFGVGPDERAVPCPVIGGAAESCWLDRQAVKLAKGDDDEKEEANQISARTSYVMNIIDLDSPEDGVQIWRCGVKAFRVIKSLMRNDDYGDPTDFEEGYSIQITKSGQGIGTNYEIIPGRPGKTFPTEKQLDHRSDTVANMFGDLADEKLELTDLDEFQKFMSDDEMKATYFGRKSDAKKTEGREGRRSSKEDDDDDKGDEKGENAEEDKPKRTRRSRKSDDESGTEDNKPSRRLRRGKTENLD